MTQGFYRDTWAEIQLDCISDNLKSLRSYLPKTTEIMAVVKANAYGHGAVEVAREAIKAGCKFLAVAILDEALHLRKNDIQTPILVLGACRPEYAPIAAENNISLTVFQKEWVEEATPYLGGQTLKVHIKCDTGMGRIGVRDDTELKDLITFVQTNKKMKVEGIFTHFASADSKNMEYFRNQLIKFKHFLQIIEDKPEWIHASNSAATLRSKESLFSLVRFGISMYGLSPSPEIKNELPFPLKEAFSLHSKLIHVKKVKKGESISYGCTYTAQEDEWIGTIPIGYADGWLRKLQGQEVVINGRRAPIVGRICMDQCMIKLPEPVPVGTKVTLIGEHLNERITIDEIACKLETINYEIPCMISNRVPRVYKRGSKIVKVENALFNR